MDHVETTENEYLKEVEQEAHDENRVSVLVVDSSPYVLGSIRRILASVPEVEVTTAMDGVEALERVRRSAPDLALVDLQLPDMNGLETTRMIKRHTPDTEVLTMSAQDDRAMEEASKHSGADAYLVKNRLYRSLLPALSARFPRLSVWVHVH